MQKSYRKANIVEQKYSSLDRSEGELWHLTTSSAPLKSKVRSTLSWPLALAVAALVRPGAKRQQTRLVRYN